MYTMSTIRTIIGRSPSLADGHMTHTNGIGPWQGVEALAEAGITDLRSLDYHALVSTPRFGRTSIEYLTIALRDEVLRLQGIVDRVHAAIDNLPV